MPHRIERIISGGQTGVDRAALDFAMANEIPHGGWCPKGRKAEDGVISERYVLCETPSAGYVQRTEWNVRDSDATVVLSMAQALSGGTKRTVEFADKLLKPNLHVHSGLGIKEAAKRLCEFLAQTKVNRLNVAGPRASKEPLVGEFTVAVLRASIRR